MNFQDAVKTCFQKYVTFSGRATRPEYWLFTLFNFICMVVLGLADGALFSTIDQATGAVTNSGPLGTIFTLATLLPAISVSVRRMHDIDKSGWFVLINLIPIVGWIIFIVWAATKGTEGSNRFGA
jgi:uncharacterized membrane protein YhaH (DUF805 family)